MADEEEVGIEAPIGNPKKLRWVYSAPCSLKLENCGFNSSNHRRPCIFEVVQKFSLIAVISRTLPAAPPP
ncbi:uncharacterized protein BO96DRAFT_408159 [Aspergillus niger CBS 101883]|uniref:uncharacterized protein n=1 Tax=Aspergillus lacticoffeatus (strain CBS 101883) TaxID=1450533 RepID=UPI000D7F108F|nr:uncharacterized protein BO96DRAFT_408159 [Aspergillus niger CBS 101883]PYH61295.1 hypothetical protein BO96DRAFT_408159 [Aspergillus niger CBS 101883]